MKKITLRSQCRDLTIEIPVSFLDSYLFPAPSDYAKVYLYLLRALKDNAQIISLEDFSEVLDLTINTAKKALLYWQEKGVLNLELSSDEISGISLCDLSHTSVNGSSAAAPVQETYHATEKIPIPVKTDFNAEDFSTLDEDGDFMELIQLAEFYLKKPVTPANRDALAYCYLMLNRNSEMTEYLLEYCIDNHHSSYPYFKAVAKAWNEAGYKTLREIKEQTGGRNKLIYGVLKALGIQGRNAAPAEQEQIVSWNKDFDLPIILEACKRTMNAIHKPDFNYVNKILASWKTKNVKTMEDVKALDEQHAKTGSVNGTRQNPFHNFQGRDTNYDELFSVD